MTRTRLVLQALVLVVGAVLGCHAGTRVELTSSPSEIQPCTFSLTVRCALATSTVTSVNPKQDIEHLTGITISRNGYIVSTITLFSQPQVVSKVDLANVKVTGNLKVNNGTEKGYLQLDWSFPFAQQTGMFKCEVRGVTGSSHQTVMTREMVVKMHSVDVMAEIHCLKTLFLEEKSRNNQQQTIIAEQQQKIDTEKSRNDQQQTIIAAQQQKIDIEKSRNDQQQTIIAAQQQKIDTDKSRNDQQQTTISQQQAKIDSLTTELSRVSHVEQGYVDCDGSSTYNDGAYNVPSDSDGDFGVSKKVRVTFKTPFVKPPVVQLSIYSFYNGKDHHEEYGAVVEKVDTDGFTMRCLTYNDRKYIVWDMDVSWISVATA